MPLIQTFRWRVLLLAAATVLASLLGLMWVGRERILAHEQVRLDERLCMEARRFAEPQSVRDGRSAWGRLGNDLGQKLRVDPDAELRLQALDGQGQAWLRSPGNWPAVPVDRLPWRAEAGASGQPDPRGDCALADWMEAARRWRVARVRSAQGQSLLAADQAALSRDLLADLEQAAWLLLPLALALATLSAWVLANLAVRPLHRLRAAMQGLTPQALDVRLSTAGEDREFQVLIEAYNTMLDRLALSFRQASRFSADAAHELRTPLTILQGKLEQAIARSEGRELQAELVLIQDEVVRLAGITRKLLLLSQADAGMLPLQRDPVDLSGLLGDLMTDAAMLDTGLRLSHKIAAGLTVQADVALLRQAFNNLLSNALKYALPGSWVHMEALRKEGSVCVRLGNRCSPLGPEARAGFFRRFYRVDSARSRQIDGSGLGLNLVREIVRAHGGEVTLEAGAQDEVWICLTLAGGTGEAGVSGVSGMEGMGGSLRA